MSILSIIVSIIFFSVVMFSMVREIKSQKNDNAISYNKVDNEKNHISSQNEEKKFYRKDKKLQKSSNSNQWLLWLLIVAAGLAVFGYFLYPIINTRFFPNKEKIIISNADSASTVNHETVTNNLEFSQTLDSVTNKKNALNPVISQPPAISTSSSKPETISSEFKPSTVVSSQKKGKYVLIIGSFTSQAAAQNHVKKVLTDGLTCEIIDAGNSRFRVSVASYDDLEEANRQANEMKSKPHCENIWVIKR